MMFDDDEAPDPIEGAPATAAGRSATALVAHPGHQTSPAPPSAFHPPAYRVVVAGWPEDWRERWGRRANELEEAGLSWRDAEAHAFVEVWYLVREGRHALVPAPDGPDPQAN
jgi:hypothetical protein